MRTHTLAVFAFMLVAASHAGAQSQSQASDYPMTGDPSVSTVQVRPPPQAFEASLADIDWISGGYRMSNGWRLDVQPGANGIVATVDRQHPMRLMAVSEDRYVTMDGNVAMAFNRGARGDEMLMSYVPRSSVAAVVVLRSSLAQR